MKKPLFAAIFLVIGLVIGGALGVYYGAQHIGRPTGRLLVLGGTAFKGINAIQLYKKGEYLAAREALLDYVKTLEEVAANPDYGDPRISRTDMALTLTRLALLEEANGHQEQANEFMHRAVEEAISTRWEEPSAKNLRRFVEEVDKYKPLIKQ
jgi:hypothetical protein